MSSHGHNLPLINIIYYKKWVEPDPGEINGLLGLVEMKKLTKMDNIFVLTGNLLYVYFRAWKASDIKALDDFLCRNKDNR